MLGAEHEKPLLEKMMTYPTAAYLCRQASMS